MIKKNPEKLSRSAANGRRSACIAYDGFLYTSGITSSDLSDDIQVQAQNVFGQLDRLMAAYDTNKHNILSATVYLKTMTDYGNFNAVWDEWVNDGFEPCRSVVEAGLALSEYRLKISLVVAIPDEY